MWYLPLENPLETNAFSSKDLHITSNNYTISSKDLLITSSDYKISSKDLLITSISSLTSGNSQAWQVEILKSDKWRTFSFSSLANPSDPRSKISQGSWFEMCPADSAHINSMFLPGNVIYVSSACHEQPLPRIPPVPTTSQWSSWI